MVFLLNFLRDVESITVSGVGPSSNSDIDDR
jgi:hypothetical protein